jgi:hypothetical protein
MPNVCREEKIASTPTNWPVKVETPFQQWGLDFIGEINPNSSGKNKWILTTTDYFTKGWNPSPQGKQQIQSSSDSWKKTFC